MNSHAAIEQLYSQCRESGCLHVLLDPQAGAPFAEEIAALDDQLAPRIHLRDRLFANTPQEAPLLVRLPLSELPLLEAMALHAHHEATDARGNLRSVCAFVQSDLPITQLAVRLTSALDVKVEGKGGVYFRYFDPRVFHHVTHLMSKPTLGGVLGGVDSWSYFLWDGSLAVRSFTESFSSGPHQLKLSPKEWEPFDTIEHFNATQRLFAEQGLRFEPTQTLQLFAEVDAAKALGLPTPNDTAYYLACSTRQGASPSQHRAWPDVVALLKQDVPLAEALDQLCGITLQAANGGDDS